ncbi:Crp/Fnr family transcriptional regulator [Sphingomonas solaris]|uniref:Crp/Fnr family transcriptional regulator n=2 Tax=Alterirhizorhabdus solaris TaxID=2529389 RepID=A0A558R9I9_9SPHN|nr:Crp/Fnr family transcriptional regulator [Sphingomonas solaris]
MQRTYQPNTYIIREGELLQRHCAFIISGFAIRQKLTNVGARQIVSMHLPGDLLDLQHLYLNYADHNVQALTLMEAAEIGRPALRRLVLRNPRVATAMWIDALVDSSISREWLLNVGQRDARGRIAHLLCEFAARMTAAGMASDSGYELPMTQEQIGDAVGLTAVHVNRTIKALKAENLITRDKRHLHFHDIEGIRAIAGFSSLYLHLDQITTDPEDRPGDERGA